MVAESWFRSLWRTPRKHDANSEKEVIGVLAFEIASLMSKLVNLWQSLSDKHISRLKEEITNSIGIKKLVSDDDHFIERLICMEIVENMAHVAESVARLSKKCHDPILKGFENTFYGFITTGTDPYGWELTCKKMEKKIKKFEKFISTNASLYQEMEVLVDLEQTLARVKPNNESDGASLSEYQKKVAWKRHEVKNLRDVSLWNRTYDYTIHLLARSLFTIFSKINHVFGIQEMVDDGGTNNSSVLNSDSIYRSQSVSALFQSSFHSSQNNNIARFSSGPLNTITARSGPIVRTNKASISHSGPLGDSSTKSGPILGKHTNVNFYSGPLGRNMNQSVPLTTTKKMSKIWNFYKHSSAITGKETHARHSRMTQVGPFKGCMAWDSSSVIDCHSNASGVHYGIQNPKVVHHTQSVFKSLCKLLNPPPETLGAAALSLHYANVIIVIEKLAASPHLIGLDARDDLYNMLPRRVRIALKAKLKPYTKTMASSSVFDNKTTNRTVTKILCQSQSFQLFNHYFQLTKQLTQETMSPDIITAATNVTNTQSKATKRAFVTFLAGNGDYVKGVVGLAKGLRKVKTMYPLVVAVLPDVPQEHRNILTSQGCIVREIVPVYPPENQTQFAMAYYVINYSKLRIWAFEDYDKMIYLDGDIQVFENIDHLFDLPNNYFYAVMDCFCEASWRHTKQYEIGYCQQCPDKVQWPTNFGPKPPLYFNAGMFVYEPNMATYHDLLQKLQVTEPTSFAEQDFLNMYFNDKYKPIPNVYNLVLAMLWRHPENVELEKVKVVHYCAAGSKPWRYTGVEENMQREDIKMLVKKWWDVYEDESLDYKQPVNANHLASSILEAYDLKVVPAPSAA